MKKPFPRLQTAENPQLAQAKQLIATFDPQKPLF
jgi:hypothetical protein